MTLEFAYSDFENFLNELKFIDFYKENIKQKNWTVDYGARKGPITFTSVKDTAEQYIYEASGMYTVKIDEQFDIPEDEKDLVILCIEIFDWGNVQKSNIVKALDLYRNKKNLRNYLVACKKWFENDQALELGLPDYLIWSSGWTKVYSLMFSKTTIYDSRVAAFINYMMVKFYELKIKDSDNLGDLQQITQKLVSFSGATNRARCVSEEHIKILGISKKYSNHRSNLIANKIASWLLRYITEIEFENQDQKNFRKVDKAMFMLGFDISQIDEEVGFT